MPILDTYKDAAAALVGCHGLGIQRESCELDVLLVTNEPRRPVSVKSGNVYLDLYFLSEKEALRPTEPEVAVSLAHASPVRDTRMIISTGIAACQAVMDTNMNRSAQIRLTSCLKSLGRAEDCASREDIWTSNYWLLSASYEFAYAWLFSQGVVPSPSHLLAQAKVRSKGKAKDFVAFSAGAGLKRASRKECAARLEGISVLYDLLGARQMQDRHPPSASPEVEFEIVKRKTGQLASSMEHAESYSFQGLEVVRLLARISESQGPAVEPFAKAAVEGILGKGGPRLLSEGLVRDLGLARPLTEAIQASATIKDRVSDLARRI
jgi:hypothetical protein